MLNKSSLILYQLTYVRPIAHIYILESPVSTPLSNQQTFVHIELLFLVENLSY